jgi:hypothetical protein
MPGLSLYRRLATQNTVWVDQICGLEDSSTGIALVSPGSRGVAVRALSLYEPVWEKSLIVFAIGERHTTAMNVAILFDFSVELSDEFLVNNAFRSCVVVKPDLECFEEFFDQPMVSVGELARRYSLLKGLNFNRCSMLIAPADQCYILALEAEVSSVDIGGEQLGKGSQMRPVVYVGPTATDHPLSQSFFPLLPTAAEALSIMIRICGRNG